MNERTGICECGCGSRTAIAKRTRTDRGDVQGQPLRFVHGHAGRNKGLTPERRFWLKVNRGDICWLWIGAKNTHGYGDFNVAGRHAAAHRFAYELLVGPIPDGLTIDHLCRNRACVNPDHLEPVTMRENLLRGEGITSRRAMRERRRR